jgi:hypothetical protein
MNFNKLGITCIPICFEEGSCLIYIFLHLSTYIVVQYDFHIIWCSYCLTITQQVPLVEQELLTLPDHPSSPLIFVRVCVVQSPVFHVLFYISLSVILFLLAIVLSVFLQFMASDYHIGIFKLFMPYFPKNCQNYKWY